MFVIRGQAKQSSGDLDLGLGPGQGWEKNDSGSLELIWSSSPMLPPSLVDLIEPSSEEESDVEEETDQELGLSEVFDCDEDD